MLRVSRLINLLLHLVAAHSAATPRVPPELLVAVAVVESDLWPRAPVSRPHGHLPPYYCGPMQTIAMSEASCRAQTENLFLGYRLGAAELEQWLRDPRVRGSVRRALIGHGCGNAGLRAGSCHNRYERRVLLAKARLDR